MPPKNDRSLPKRTKYAYARSRKNEITIAHDSEYKLTFPRLLKLLSEREPVNEKPLYRNRVTKQPMRRSGRSTLNKTVGFVSAGSLDAHYRKRRDIDAEIEVEVWTNFNLAVYIGMWLFIQLAEDSNGKGIFDPADPEQRELREILPDYRDIARLNFESAPDVRDFLEQENPELLPTVDRLFGKYDPIAEIYDRIRQIDSQTQKTGIQRLRRLVLLYAGENNVAGSEDIAELMLLNLADSNAKEKIRKKLIEALTSINKLELMDLDSFTQAIVPLAESLVTFEGEDFKDIEALLNYVGLTSD